MDLRHVIFAVAALLTAGPLAIPANADGGPSGHAFYSEGPSIWQGLYFGGHAGLGTSGDISGAIGGFQVGYNWQVHRFVYGLEADFSLSNIGGGTSVSFGGMTASASASVDW